MGGFFGITSKRDCLADVFFGTDYHSHLGTRRGGMAAYDPEIGLQRKIHSIENAPFRTRFEHIFEEMYGTAAIGCISDSEPQPLLIRSCHGTYAICVIGRVNNAETLIDQYLSCSGGHFDAKTGGSVNTVELLAARDRLGRLPVTVGRREDGYAVSFESFAYEKLGFIFEKELGPGEIVELTPERMTQLRAPGREKRICSFLWSYYGYPTSTYEGVNVEAMRYRNGEILARADRDREDVRDIDYVGGVPDSGTPHAIGYANESGKHFARAFIKYTPTWARSFMPPAQVDRNTIAKMKQIPVTSLIKDKNLLFVDDSIVRGTQLRETVEFLYENGAKAVHMRSACPPIMFGCKYLNFSRATSDLELIARRVILELEGEAGFEHLDEYADGGTERGKKLRANICERFHFSSLEFQSLESVIEAIGLPECDLCTYCWNGKE